jgi:hypothetical protein
MIKITDGTAQINLSKYQTKIFNLKRWQYEKYNII